jgi:hypothetical protein
VLYREKSALGEREGGSEEGAEKNKSIQRIHTPRMDVKNGSGPSMLNTALHGMQPPPELTNTS